MRLWRLLLKWVIGFPEIRRVPRLAPARLATNWHSIAMLVTALIVIFHKKQRTDI